MLYSALVAPAQGYNRSSEAALIFSLINQPPALKVTKKNINIEL